MMPDLPKGDPHFMIGYLSSILESNGRITVTDWRNAVAATDEHAKRVVSSRS